MLHQDCINRITSLIAALQQYVTVHSDSGLVDVGSSVEVLISGILRITEGLELINLNLLHVNFPAIDLADKKRGVAIQVTSNVTTEKWKTTVAKFRDHGLQSSYRQLRILGFCRSVKPRAVPAHVVVQGPKAFLGGLKNIDVNQLRDLERLLRESYDFSKLTPLKDEDCFNVVLRVLDRDAIRHYTSVEGSYDDFARALKEIKEVINAGCIPEKGIYAKPLSQYSHPYDTLLRDIDLQLAQMLAEVNRARKGSHYYLGFVQKQAIDKGRTTIIEAINDFCRTKGIAIQIRGIH